MMLLLGGRESNRFFDRIRPGSSEGLEPLTNFIIFCKLKNKVHVQHFYKKNFLPLWALITPLSLPGNISASLEKQLSSNLLSAYPS